MAAISDRTIKAGMLGIIVGVIVMWVTRIYAPNILRPNGVLFAIGIILFMLGLQADKRIPVWVTLLCSAIGAFMFGFFPGHQ